jgi:hypothetical protein
MPAETINLIVTQDFNITTTMAFVDPFQVANYINGAPLYRWEFLSEHGGHLRSSNGATLETTAMQAVNAPTDYTIEVKKERNGHVANRLQAALWREAISLVRDGVATIEDVDMAVWAGPGLRWAAMGPTTLFHLGAGAGGLQAFCEHFADTFHGW